MPSMAFFVGVYRDQVAARRVITALRTFYPQADILSLSDGVDDRAYAKFCAERRVVYELNPSRLKVHPLGGAWTKRRFEFFLDRSRAEVCVKVDPDVLVQHPARAIPRYAAAFAYPLAAGSFHGGVFGISRALIETILASGLLDAREFTRAEYSYPRFSGTFLKRGEQEDTTPVVAEDGILREVFRQLGIAVTAWPDVAAKKFMTPRSETAQYAFVHP